MTSYIFIEKFGPGGTASRNRKVNEIEITDADKHEFRIEVLSGHRMDEAAREFFHAGGADPDAILCTTDESAGSAYGAGPHYWVEQADPDLYIEDLNGDFSYRLKDHPCALIPQV